MKVTVEIEIEDCRDCTYFHQTFGLAGEAEFCSHQKVRGEGNGFKWIDPINDTVNIPEWCPLKGK